MMLLILLWLLLIGFLPWLLTAILNWYRFIETIILIKISLLVNCSTVGHLLWGILDWDMLIICIYNVFIMLGYTSYVFCDFFIIDNLLGLVLKIKLIHDIYLIHWWCHIFVIAYWIITGYLLNNWISCVFVKLIMKPVFKGKIILHSDLV